MKLQGIPDALKESCRFLGRGQENFTGLPARAYHA